MAARSRIETIPTTSAPSITGRWRKLWSSMVLRASSVDESGVTGHQIMPALTFGAGRLSLLYYDLREDVSRIFGPYVDEFPMFTTASIDVILSEARKYRLSLILAMQYLDQLDTKLLGAVLGNVGNLVVFRVGAQDAAFLGRELAPVSSTPDPSEYQKTNEFESRLHESGRSCA